MAQNMYNQAEKTKNHMKEITYGYRWKTRPGRKPALLSATTVVAPVEHRLVRLQPPYWVLDYEFSAFGKYRVGRRSDSWHPRRPHTAHLYPPQTILWEDTRKSESRRNSAWVMFADAAPSDLTRLIPRPRAYAEFLDSQDRLGHLMRRAAEIGRTRGEQGFWAAQAILCEMLDLLASARATAGETYTIDDEPERTDMYSLAESVSAFMRDHLAERVTLERIAKHLHVSVSLLSHKYRLNTGDSPKTALTRFRVEQAKTLLFKGYPLKAIARQCGFADAFHFSKTFKQLEGISPRDFVRGPR